MEQLIKEYINVTSKIKLLDAEKDAIKTQIKVKMKEQGIDAFEDGNGNLVTYKKHTREKLNKERVKELLGDLKFKEVVQVTEYENCRVTSKEGREKLKSFLGGN